MPPDTSYTPPENADEIPQTCLNPWATGLASLGTDLVTASPPNLHPGWELYPVYPTRGFIRESFDTRSRDRETITASRPQTVAGIQIAAPVAGVNPPIFNLHNVDPRLRTIFHGHTNHLTNRIPQPITMPHQPGLIPQHAPPHLMGPVPQPIGILNQGNIAQSAVPPPMGTSTQNATTLHHTGFQAVLPDRVLAVLNTQAYDSYWLMNRGINLDSFSLTSALKLDKLFRVGALRTGDSFVIVVDTLNNRVVNTSRKEITVSKETILIYNSCLPLKGPFSLPKWAAHHEHPFQQPNHRPYRTRWRHRDQGNGQSANQQRSYHIGRSQNAL